MVDNTLILVLLLVIIACIVIMWNIRNELHRQKLEVEAFRYKQSEARFEALVENGSDCVIIISPEGKTTYVSRSVKNILGYTPGEVMDIDIRSVIHPEDLAGSEDALLRTLANPGIPVQGHTSRIKHKNGSWRWVEPVVTNMIHDPAINGIVDNFRDVTDRIRAEEELKKTNERFKLATRGSKLGIWDHDLINDELIWGETMFKIYGIADESADMSNDAWLTLIHPEDLPRVQKQVEDTLQDGEGYDIEFRIIQPDSTVRYFRSLAQVYRDEHGKAVRFVGTNLDITKQKEYELTLEQILFDISHIIRKPVSNLLGLTQLIDLETIDETDLKQSATYMKESAKELDDFTTTLTATYLKKKISNQIKNPH